MTDVVYDALRRHYTDQDTDSDHPVTRPLSAETFARDRPPVLSARSRFEAIESDVAGRRHAVRRND